MSVPDLALCRDQQVLPCQRPLGKENAMTDIPSRSFGSVSEWFCQTDNDLLTLFNARLPLPGQGSWTVFRITSRVFTRVTSILRMRDIGLEEWRRLPKIGAHIGNIGAPMSRLWEWSLSCRGSVTPHECESSQGLPHGCGVGVTDGESASRLQQSVAQLQPLARRSPWPAK